MSWGKIIRFTIYDLRCGIIRLFDCSIIRLLELDGTTGLWKSTDLLFVGAESRLAGTVRIGNSIVRLYDCSNWINGLWKSTDLSVRGRDWPVRRMIIRLSVLINDYFGCWKMPVFAGSII